jgi:starch phosphorylase
MIEEYTREFYHNADMFNNKLRAQDFALARQMAKWQEELITNWQEMKVISVEDNLPGDVNLGSSFTVKATIQLGKILPENVAIQLYWGYLDSKRRMDKTVVSSMKLINKVSNTTFVFEGKVTGDRVGHCGYIIRILPQLNGQVINVPGLITWQ